MHRSQARCIMVTSIQNSPHVQHRAVTRLFAVSLANVSVFFFLVHLTLDRLETPLPHFLGDFRKNNSHHSSTGLNQSKQLLICTVMALLHLFFFFFSSFLALELFMCPSPAFPDTIRPRILGS